MYLAHVNLGPTDLRRDERAIRGLEFGREYATGDNVEYCTTKLYGTQTGKQKYLFHTTNAHKYKLSPISGLGSTVHVLYLTNNNYWYYYGEGAYGTLS